MAQPSLTCLRLIPIIMLAAYFGHQAGEVQIKKESYISGVIKSFGVVFGDIGTSPIYTLTVIFLLLSPTEANILGVLSLVVWSMIILVTVEYAWLAMSLSRKGEGGTIVLKEILTSLLKSGRQASFVALLAVFGISLLVGDGVITPAISILSAVEGMLLIPGLEDMHQTRIIMIASVIAIALFSIQRRGTERVAFAFGPIMFVWFSILAVSGIVSLIQAPVVINAINPYYAVRFFLDNGFTAFVVLSEVILCATGGEALYADMGHLGRLPILRAWYIVFFALLLNYLGQGAFLLLHPETKTVLFGMIQHQAPLMYIPFLLLSIMATVIASQAMISGIFSIIYQGITTHIIPIFKVEYTSSHMHSQIYVGFANWFLLIAVLVVMQIFGASSNLAAAYGLAVNGDMVLTGFMMAWIFLMRGMKVKLSITLFVIVVDLLFLASNFTKIPHGGYWSLIIASIPFTIILIYTYGQKKLYRSLVPMPIEEFLHIFNYRYQHESRIRGTALYFTRYVGKIPPYIFNTMFLNGIIYEDNMIVAIVRRDDPYGVTGFFHPDIATGFRHFEIQYGYMEVFDLEEVLKEAGIEEKTIFYGIEDISTNNIIWRTFSLIKKVCPTFVQFYKLPSFKLHGVVTRVEM